MPINSFLYPAPSTPTFAYVVANSIRFDDGSSDSFNRTPSSAGSTRLATFSFWLKRGHFGITPYVYMVKDGSNNQFGMHIDSNDKLVCFHYNGSGYDFSLTSTSSFRDPSAWYHFVIKIDTANGTAIERLKLFVNGVYDAWNTTISQNFDGIWLKNSTAYIGSSTTPHAHYDGYFAEFVVIDGTALEPTSFGEFDEDSPTIWKPIDVSGLTFGTNGFYLDFEDSSSLGNDAAGSNNFTVNNLTAIDQTTDTCTNNFCTVNALDNYHQQATLSEGNTKITFKGPSSYYAYSTGTFGVASGKWYWETKATSAGNHNVYGISGRYVIAYNKGLGVNTDEYGYYNYNGNYTNASSDGSYAENSFSGGNVTWTTNDIIGIALDLDSGTNTVKFYKNNALIGTVNIIAPSSGFYYPAWNQFDNQTEACQPNFGNPSYSLSSAQSDANGYGSFEFAPPSGYYALCSKNLAEYG